MRPDGASTSLTLSAQWFTARKGSGRSTCGKGSMGGEALIHGGKQEGGLRGGTENTPAIVAAGRAALLASERLSQMGGRVAGMRDALFDGIQKIVPGARLNGHPEEGCPIRLT